MSNQTWIPDLIETANANGLLFRLIVLQEYPGGRLCLFQKRNARCYLGAFAYATPGILAQGGPQVSLELAHYTGRQWEESPTVREREAAFREKAGEILESKTPNPRRV